MILKQNQVVNVHQPFLTKAHSPPQEALTRVLPMKWVWCRKIPLTCHNEDVLWRVACPVDHSLSVVIITEGIGISYVFTFINSSPEPPEEGPDNMPKGVIMLQQVF